MSLKTWKKEFYPKPANETTKAESLEHSIKKWEGLTDVNLNKHKLGICLEEISVYEKNNDWNGFLLDSSSCSLCYHFLDNSCVDCPLYKGTAMSCDEDNSRYREVMDGAPVSVMINSLKKARKFHNVKQKSK